MQCGGIVYMKIIILLICLMAISASAFAFSLHRDYSSFLDHNPGNCAKFNDVKNINITYNRNHVIGGSKSDIQLQPNEFALTFDDGPTPFTTSRIVNILVKNCVPATFFEIGIAIRAFPWISRKVKDLGFTMGTHSYLHRNLKALSPSQARWEILAGFEELDQALNIQKKADTRLFRFPRWQSTDQMIDFVHSQQGISIFADLSPEDWRGDAPDIAFARFKKRLAKKDRGIIVLHDKEWNTAPLTQMIIDEIRRRGGTFVNFTIDDPHDPMPN